MLSLHFEELECAYNCLGCETSTLLTTYIIPFSEFHLFRVGIVFVVHETNGWVESRKEPTIKENIWILLLVDNTNTIHPGCWYKKSYQISTSVNQIKNNKLKQNFKVSTTLYMNWRPKASNKNKQMRRNIQSLLFV